MSSSLVRVVLAHLVEDCEDFSGEVALELPESSSGGEALFGAVVDGVVGGIGVPAGPHDPKPGAGQDPDGMGVALAASAGVGVGLGRPR
jgi:hypothetical protein